MSKRANPGLIGAFVLGAVLLAGLALMLLGGGELFSDRQRYVTYFQGSVQGLRVGSNVNFRGVRVGEVVEILVRIDDSELEVHIPVVIEIVAGAMRTPDGMGILPRVDQRLLKQLIDRGLRAQLQMESFVTGQLLVDLDFYPDSRAMIRGPDDGLPEIPTVPSEIQAALERAQMFVAKIQSMPVEEIVSNVNRITQGIDRLVNSPRLENILAGVDRIVSHPEATKIVPELTRTIAELGDAATELKRLGQLANQQGGPIADRAEQTLTQIRTLSGELQGLVADLRRHTGAESTLRYELGSLAREGKESLRSFRSLTDYLERHPEALLRGRSEEEETP